MSAEDTDTADRTLKVMNTYPSTYEKVQSLASAIRAGKNIETRDLQNIILKLGKKLKEPQAEQCVIWPTKEQLAACDEYSFDLLDGENCLEFIKANVKMRTVEDVRAECEAKRISSMRDLSFEHIQHHEILEAKAQVLEARIKELEAEKREKF